MLFLRRLGIGLTASLFSFLLVLFALSITMYKVFDTPASLQKALRTSGIYDVFVEKTLTQKQKEGEINLPTDQTAQAAVNQATTGALSPGFIQKTTEQSLNQVYDWLHGRTKKLEVAVDITPAKTAFANNIAGYVQQKAAALPVCTHAVPPPTNLDELLALDCRPAGVSAEMLAGGARDQALNNQTFDQLTLTANNLKDDKDRPLGEKFEAVPKAHRYFILSLYVIPVILLLCAAAIIFGSATRRNGTKRVAHMLIWTGILSIVFAMLTAWGLHRLGSSLSGSGEAVALQSNILRLVNSLASDLRLWWAGTGAIYALVGVGLLVVVRLIGKHTAHEVEALNKSLGYNDVPSAGTTFDPDKALPEPRAATPTPKRPADPKTKNPPKAS